MRRFLTQLSVALLTMLFVSLVLAQARPTVLTLTGPLEPQAIGERVVFQAKLVNELNEPQANKVLLLYVNGQETRRARTDEAGGATINLSGDLPLGVYDIRAAFIGTRDYAPSEAQTTLSIRPMMLTIETVPPLANIPISINEQLYMTNEAGLVQLELTNLGGYKIKILLEPDTTLNADTRIAFDRWDDSEFTPERTIEVTGDAHVQAGFKLSYLVSQTFIDLENKPFDPSVITEFTLKSSNGTYYTFQDNAPRWLPASRIQRYRAGLGVTDLQYSVESVTINGTNVVNRFQQRFLLKPNDIWQIQLLLYSASIRAKDAFFGFPVGTGIMLSFPDGHSMTLEFGADQAVHTGLLARGEYKVKVVGVGGVTPATPVALSRNQTIELAVLSTLDLGVAGAAGILGAFGLLFYGRPHLIGIKRKRQPSTVYGVQRTMSRDMSKPRY
jgi:hypothetical protein